MHITVDALLIDTPDPDALAAFYEGLLGFVRTFEDEGEVLIAAADGSGFPLLFVESDDPKTAKNRLHLDLRPDDQAEAVRTALRLGATHVDVGQHEDPDVTWVVLADPDGNEFCILQGGVPADLAAVVADADADAVPVDPRTGLPPVLDEPEGLDEEDEDEDLDDLGEDEH